MKKLFLITVLAAGVFCSFHIDNTGFHKTGIKRRSTVTDTAEDLPRSYKQRKFLNDITSISYDLFTIPGNIVTFHPKDTTYEFRTTRGLIKGNKLPVTNALTNGELYYGLITPKTSFNGSYLINNLRAEKDEVMELTIKDEAISTVPDSLVDVDAVKSAIKGIPAEELKDLFYVKAATLTSIENRKYTLTKFDNTKNGFYLNLNGKTYSTKEKIKMDRVVSMFLIPLDRLNH